MRILQAARDKTISYLSLMLVAVLAMLALLILAPAAGAQNFFNPGGDCPEGFVAQGDFCVTPETARAIEADPLACEGIVTTEEFVACLDAQHDQDVAEAPLPLGETPTLVDEASGAGDRVFDDLGTLPESGGPAFLLPLAGMILVATGLGLAALRRRA